MNVLRFDSAKTWVDGLVAFWRDRLRLNPRLRMCLPAGNTPQPVYAGMVDSVRRGQVSFAEAEIFALDEYGGLPPGDPGRCANQLRRSIIEPVDIVRFRFLNSDAPDVDRACRDYEAAIGNGFDLVLLGIGLNGHLGLNEPGTAPDSLTRRVDMHPESVKAAQQYLGQGQAPTWGMTVGMKQLLGAREVWLMASGIGKSSIVRRLARGVPGLSVPASLMQRHPNCYLFVDADAGRELWG